MPSSASFLCVGLHATGACCIPALVTKRGRPKKSRKQRVVELKTWKKRCKSMARTLPPLDDSGFLPAWTLTRLRAAWAKHERAQNMTEAM